MALTVLDVSRSVQRRLDGEPSVPVIVLCNHAGRSLTQMHEWNWLLRPPAVLRLQAGVSHCYPPDDFGREVTPQNAVSPGWRLFKIVSQRELAGLRESVAQPAGPYRYYASPIYEKGEDGALRLRFELFPTPTEASSDVKLWYRAKWVALEDDDEIIPIPEALELLYLEIVMAVAQGIDEHDMGSLSSRLAELAMSPLFHDAVAEDGLIVSSPVPMGGGMVRHAVDNSDGWLYYPTSISSPGG